MWWKKIDEYKRIRTVGVLWSDLIENKNQIDISSTIIYKDFTTDYFLILPSEFETFSDKLYSDKVDKELFDKFLDNAKLMKGNIINHQKFEIAKKIDFKEYIGYLLKDKSRNNESFELTYVCKECGMPEDECELSWIINEDDKKMTLMKIINDGNMWTIKFKK